MMTTSLRLTYSSVRSLLRHKSLVLNAACTLAIGIGVNVAVFSLLEAVLSDQPAGVERPAGLFRLSFRLNGLGGVHDTERVPFPLFMAAREVASGHVKMAAEAIFPAGFGRGDASREISAVLVTGGYFEALGVRPALGRAFSAEEAETGQRLVLLSHEAHRRFFAGDPAVLGSSCWIANRAYTIVGVLPPGFRGLDPKSADVWLPLRASIGDLNPVGLPSFAILSNPSVHPVRVVARLSPGSSPDQAENTLTDRLKSAREKGLVQDEVLGVRLTPVRASRLQRDILATFSGWAAILAAATLLAACANVANLLMARDLDRTREVAIHRHLGAKPSDIWLRALTESLVCAVLGGGLATGVTLATLHTLSRTIAGREMSPAAFNGLPYVAILILSVLAATLLSGIPSAYRLTRIEIGAALKNPKTDLPTPWRRIRFGLVVLQLAVSTCLLVEAGLFLTGIAEASRVSHLGFNPRDLLVAQMPGLRNIDQSPEWSLGEQRRLAQWAESRPAVASVAAATSPPLEATLTVSATARDEGSERDASVNLIGVSPGYFNTLQIDRKGGRTFVPSDSQGASLVTVVDEVAATTLWPHQSPIGECLQIAGGLDCAEVVGVVSSAASLGIFGGQDPQIYVPIDQVARFPVAGGDTRALLVRVQPGALAQAERQIRSLPGAPYVRVHPLTDWVDVQLQAWRLGLTLSGMLAAISLFVSALGSHGQLSYWLRSRNHEFGVRVALGATPKGLFALVARKSLALTGVGVGSGILFSLLAARLTARFFHGNVSNPVATIALVILIQGLLGLLCTLQVGGRALAVDPGDLLRTE